MTTVNIHGKLVSYDDSKEYGLYQREKNSIGVHYAVMEAPLLFAAIRNMPLDRAIREVTALYDLATEQAAMTHAPSNMGSPILMQRPPPQPIDEVRPHLVNTKELMGSVLQALRGE